MWYNNNVNSARKVTVITENQKERPTFIKKDLFNIRLNKEKK